MLGLPFLDTAFRALKPGIYDDIVDRMHYYVTPLILFFFAILVSAKQYVGTPIQCWLPAEFRGGWEQYVEDYCFVQSTYYTHPMKPLQHTSADEESDAKLVSYYQWVPIMLSVQAVMFYLPHFLWKVSHWHSGLNLKAVMQMAKQSAGIDPEIRLKNVQLLARYLEDSLGLQTALGWPRRCGAYVTCLYLFIKILNMVNIVGQFFLLNGFLGADHSFWGFQLLIDVAQGHEWINSGYFPRVTFCDYNYQTLANVEYRTTQCVLMINMFNEKLYIFVWFWFFFLALCTGVNLMYWLAISFLPSMRTKIVHKYLRVTTHIGETMGDWRRVRQFTRHALCYDGVLVLRFISSEAGEMVATELTTELWNRVESKLMTIRSLRTESLHSEKTENGGLMETLYEVDGTKKLDSSGEHSPLDHSKFNGGGYPGPPVILPKPKM